MKPPTTYEQQITLLQSRGLIIPDQDKAIEILKRINYYRISAYSLTLKDKTSDMFIPGATFEDVYALYEFDRKLRQLLTGVLETIEISFRSRLAYELAHRYDSLGYQQSENFTDELRHSELLQELTKAVRNNQEVFIEHHLNKYGGQFPIWVAIELLSFGTVSKLYSNMLEKDKMYIARHYYRTDNTYLQTWLRSAVHTRNICAHHGRIYNKFSKVTPKLYKKYRNLLDPKRIFTAILVLRALHPSRSEWITFVINLDALIEEYSKYIDLYNMGFPSDWIDLVNQPY